MSESTSEPLCSICREEYNVGDSKTKLQCQHEFHNKCIKEWLIRSNKCPLCRGDIMDEGLYDLIYPREPVVQQEENNEPNYIAIVISRERNLLEIIKIITTRLKEIEGELEFVNNLKVVFYLIQKLFLFTMMIFYVRIIIRVLIF